MRVEDLARRLDAVGGVRELLADPAALLERAERALDLRAHGGRVQPLGVAAGHQHAGAGERVGDAGAPSGALLGVVDHEQLVAVDLAQRLRARRQLLLGRARPRRRRRRRAGPSPRRAPRARPSWPRASSWPRRRSARAAEPEQPSIADQHVALAAADARQVADRVAVVALRRRRSRRSPRTPPPRTGGPWRSSGRARRRPRAPSRARPAASAISSCSAPMRWFISRRWACCWSDDWRIAATAWLLEARRAGWTPRPRRTA